MKNLLNNKIQLILLSVFFCLTANAQEVILLQDTQQVKEFVLEESITPAKAFKTEHIDQQILDEKQGTSLGDLLQQNSSVFIKSYGQGGLATASIRGTGASHTKVYWNGIELNQPSLGQIDFSLLPVNFADEIELHLGNSSMVDGFGGLGGSIQLSNKAIYNKKLKLDAQSSVGSFSDYRNHIHISVGKEKWSYKGSVIFNSAQNDFEFENIAQPESPLQKQVNAGFEQKAITQEVYYKMAPGEEISFKGFYTETNREIPGVMTNTQPSEQTQNDRLLLGSLYYSKTGKRSWLDIRSGWVYSEMDYNDEEIQLYSRNFNSGWKNQIRYNYYATNALNIKTAVFAEFDQAKTAGYRTHEQQNKLALLAGVEWQISKNIEIEGFIRPESINDTIVPFLPSVGLQYIPFLTQKFSVNATWARNFHFPGLNDLYWTPGGNPNLKPESGWNAEFSLRKQRNNQDKKFQYEIDVTGFYGEIENWILWSPGLNGYWESNNLRAVEHQGIETQLKLQLNHQKWKVDFMGSHSFIESTHVSSDIEGDAALGKQLIYVPIHKIQYEAAFQYHSYRLVLGYNYIGNRYTTTDNTTYMPEYDLLNLRVNKRFKIGKSQRIFLQFEVNNIMDKPYMSLPWRPMPGRNYRFTLRYTFDRDR